MRAALVRPLDLRASISIARSQGYQSAEEGKARFSAPAHDAIGFLHTCQSVTGECTSEDVEAAIAAAQLDPAKRYRRCGLYGSSWRVAWLS